MFLCQAEDGIRDLVRSRGLGDVYKIQATRWLNEDTPAYFLDPGKWGGYSKGYNDGNLVKTVVVELSPMNELTEAVLWESDEIVTVAAGATKTITAKLRQPATSIYGMVSAVDWRAGPSGGTGITGKGTHGPTKKRQQGEVDHSTKTRWGPGVFVGASPWGDWG